MKRILALLLALVMCLSVLTLAGCKKGNDTNADGVGTDNVADTDVSQDVFLTFYAFCDEEQEYKFNATAFGTQEEYSMISVPAKSGEKIGDALTNNDYNDITPIESKGKFEGWMEYKEVSEVVNDSEQFSYEKLSGDKLYTTKELLNKKAPDYSVMYVAKWENISDDFYAMMGY